MSSRIAKAVFIVGCPRSGTTIFHRALAQHHAFWSPFGESHRVFEGPFVPDLDRGDSNRLTADALTPVLATRIVDALWRSTIHHASGQVEDFATAPSLWGRLALRGRSLVQGMLQAKRRPTGIYLLEKTPKNCLRVPMLAALIPGARFIFIDRDAGRTIDSLLKGWRTWDRFGPIKRKRFGTYRIGHRLELRDYAAPWWCYALVPGWQALRGMTLADVCAAQYRACNEIAAKDLAALPPEQVLRVRFEDFQADPDRAVEMSLAFAGLESTPRVREFVRQHVRRESRGGAISQEAARAAEAVADVRAIAEQLMRAP
jgi:hypothetical protein